MQEINDVVGYFNKGFPLDRPAVVLSWNTPLNVVAAASGGQWNHDRYSWPISSFLDGLEFMLWSEVAVAIDAPFRKISALVGLNPKTCIWSDELSLKGFDGVSLHLSKLFGAPGEQSEAEPTDGRFMSWKFGNFTIHLGIVEIHCFRCTLNVSCSDVSR